VAGPAADRIDVLLAAEQDVAEAELAAMMRTRRYFAMLAELRAWREQLPIEYDRPGDEVKYFLAKAERTVRRRLKKAGDDDVRLHRARKAAKRARYAAELSRPVTGSSGRKAEERNHEIQRRLGDHQDAVVAADFLRRVAEQAAVAGEDGFVLGMLYAREVAAK